MKERPILFSGSMVRAILSGNKCQTRRVVKSQPTGGWGFDGAYGRITSPHHKKGKFGAFIQRGVGTDFPETDLIVCPYGQPGDRLWVRESFAHIYRDNSSPERRSFEDVAYMADGRGIDIGAYGSWKPSIHMPRWASRITLEITSVRVERLHDISEADARAEGASQHPDGPWHAYRSLWTLINGPDSWAANPWVWCIEFQRIKQRAP